MALTASEEPQVSADLMYEDALVPVRFSEVRVRAAVPVFLMVTVWAAVVLPTVVEAKVSEVGDRVTTGAVVVLGHALTRLLTFTEPRPAARS